jgi:cellulose synthase (UDP-forming)
VFITATCGFFLRKRRFVVAPKTVGETDATRRVLWPQYLVLGLNAIAIPVGIVSFGRPGGLPIGALVGNLMWATLTFGVAALAIRYALRAASYRRREYRFPMPVPLRVAQDATHETVGLASDISPLGCRLIGGPIMAAEVGKVIEGELLSPTGPLRVQAVVRVMIPAGKGAQTEAAGCEFRWGLSDERNQLEMFLFGSDLQWQLNGFEDRIRPPLQRITEMVRGSRREPRRLAGQTWSPVLYKRVNLAKRTGVGFISNEDPSTGTRTMVSMGVLPRNGRLYAEEVTAHGPRGVVGRVADEEILETHASPIYLYKLTA